MYTLTGSDGLPYLATTKGTIGGNRRSKIYGRLDCPTALRAIASGGYITQRVFFLNAETAVHAGYRPCAACMPEAFRQWKASTDTA
jgi:methylphosphotriester-DNA--protein-cysteine methyltransferase